MTHIPVRQCSACRERNEKSALMRFVAVSGAVVYDDGGKLEGRGAYLCRSAGCVRKAKKSNALGRALHAAAPESFYDGIMREVEK